ncbi:MAG: DUF5803 family protein [Haloarculaceae archaeon]
MRRAAPVLLLVLLVVTSGCTGLFGPGSPNPDDLAAHQQYDWNTSFDATVRVNKNNYTTVLNVANKTTGAAPNESSAPGGTIELYQRDALGTEQPLSLQAVQYRYPNGSRVVYRNDTTVLVTPDGEERNVSALAVERTRKRTVVSLPGTDGQLAYTTPKTGKQVTTPTFVEGSYEVVLPPDTSVAIPLLARVRPGGATTTRIDGRVHVQWEPIRGPSLVVRYYLDRDIQIFGVLVALLLLVGIGGAGYYLLQIRELVAQREEVGLDVDVTDDDRRRPPPGMR